MENTMKISFHPKYLAEMLGTFVLALFVGMSVVAGLPTPFLAGFALMLVVYSLGPISGAHINPAVTLGLLSVKKISAYDAVWYIIAQIVGAILALFVLKGFFSTFTTALPHISPDMNFAKTFFAEMIGAFFFAFGIATIAFKKEVTLWNGAVIGGSLFLGIVIAGSLGSFAILNPAVAALVLGSSIHIIYILAPIVGSVAAFMLRKYLGSGK